MLGGQTIVDTCRAHRVLETSHPPVYYVPIEDVEPGVLRPTPGPGTSCEWKGLATYFDVVAGGRHATRAAWAYPRPEPGFGAIKDAIAFYPSAMDACLVDDEEASPQPGGFYGGWITSDLSGPFKGVRGSAGW